MAAQQLLRQKKKSSKEIVLFPENITTEQQSMVLVKRLLAISVSCITYMRGLFPESSYGIRYLDDLCLKILREDKNCLGSLQIVKWIQGCFDALEKQYLHMAVLAIYTNPEEPETVTELYQFKFKYKKNVPQMEISRWILEELLAMDAILPSSHREFVTGVGSEDVKRASRLLLRRLYLLMQNLGPLPNDITLTMKLLYYNDVTPRDYQPPGFKEDSSPGDLLFGGDPVGLRVGSVSTDFHLMKVKVTTDKKRVRKAGSSLIQKNGPTEISHQGLDCEEEEEEDSTKNHLPPVRADLSEHEGEKSDTHPGRKMEASSSCLEDTGGKKKMGMNETDRMPCSRVPQQTFFTCESQVLSESYPFLSTPLGQEALSPAAGFHAEQHDPPARVQVEIGMSSTDGSAAAALETDGSPGCTHGAASGGSRGSWDQQGQQSCSKHGQGRRFLSTLSTRVVNISEEGVSTTSLDDLCHYLVALTVNLLNLAFSQEEVIGPEKKRKVSEAEKVPLNSRKLCSF